MKGFFARAKQLIFRYEFIISLLVFAFLWSGFLIYSGTLTSGYHLIDDHEMLRISDDLSTSNPLSVSVDWVKTDLLARFRPMYYIHRVFSIWLLGTNFTAQSVLLLGMAILSSWLLYLFARKIGFGKITSFLFVWLTLLGAQATIWWRLGPQESTGILWFALGLLFMAKAVYDGPSRRMIYNIVAIGSFLLASLTKESFVVLLPVVMLWWLILYCRKNDVNLIQAIRAHLIQIITLTIVCLAELAVIFLKVGTTGIGYAGTDSQSFSIHKLLATFNDLITASNPFLTVFLVDAFILALVLSIIFSKGRVIEKMKAHLPVVKETVIVLTLVSLYVTSQVVLYAKSGIYERYLIPATLALAFLVIFLIVKIQQLISHRVLKVVVTLILVVATIVSLRYQYALARNEAKPFTSDGVMINRAFDKLAYGTQVDDAIVIIADPALDFEASISTNIFLEIQAKKTNIYRYPLWSEQDVDYTPFLIELGNYYISQLGEQSLAYVDLSQVKGMITFIDTDKAFQVNAPAGIEPEKFERFEYGKFVVYLRKPEAAAPTPVPVVVAPPAPAADKIEKLDGLTYFTSEELGISFVAGSNINVVREGNRVYISPVSFDVEDGQWVEVFSKDSNETLAQAIEEKFLQGYDPAMCYVTMTGTNTAIIDYPPPTDPNQYGWYNAQYCPPYSKTNGIAYFMASTKDSETYVYLSIGQYSIPGDSDNNSWFNTLEFI
jgi:hypothetical protein